MFLLFLLSVVAAAPVYSRTYLRGLQKQELITAAITHIEYALLVTAKQGLTHYTTPPFSCEQSEMNGEIADNLLNIRSNSRYNLDKEKCETIVRDVRAAVSRRFPDSDLTYDASTHQYTLSWV